MFISNCVCCLSFYFWKKILSAIGSVIIKNYPGYCQWTNQRIDKWVMYPMLTDGSKPFTGNSLVCAHWSVNLSLTNDDRTILFSCCFPTLFHICIIRKNHLTVSIWITVYQIYYHCHFLVQLQWIKRAGSAEPNGNFFKDRESNKMMNNIT